MIIIREGLFTAANPESSVILFVISHALVSSTDGTEQIAGSSYVLFLFIGIETKL